MAIIIEMKNKNICILIIILILLLSYGIVLSADLGSQKVSAEMVELVGYIGEYIIGDMISLPRAALMEGGVAKRNTDIPRKQLLISVNGIKFNNAFFKCEKVIECDHDMLSRYYNVGGIYAVNLCEKDKKVKIFSFCNVAHADIRIDLILNEDGALKLWVGEAFVYIGGYEVIPLNDV